MSPGCLAAQLPCAPLRVDGLVAGAETFSAGADADGIGYISELTLSGAA